MGGRVSGESAWRRSRIAVPVASPAAGADWTLTVPAGHLYQLLAVFATLTTSAVAATRIARLTLSDGVRTLADVPPISSQITTLVRRYLWLPAGQAYATGLGILSPLPDLTLAAGWTVGTTTDAIDAGDQWSGIFVHVLDVTARRGKLDLSEYPDWLVEVYESAAVRSGD